MSTKTKKAVHQMKMQSARKTATLQEVDQRSTPVLCLYHEEQRTLSMWNLANSSLLWSREIHYSVQGPFDEISFNGIPKDPQVQLVRTDGLVAITLSVRTGGF